MYRRLVDVFNAGVLAHAVAAADRDGLLDAVEQRGAVSLPPGDSRAAALAYALADAGIFEIADSQEVVAGALFSEALEAKAYFRWLFDASSPAFAGKRRDQALVAATSAELGRRHIDPVLLGLPELQSADRLLDLGCGDGSRLSRILSDAPSMTGIGVELNRDVARVSAGTVAAATEGRGSVICADVLNLPKANPALERVDTALMALMGHDLWPRERCIETLLQWRDAMPELSTLIICETVRSKERAPGIPSAGYELLHACMGIHIATLEEWDSLLRAAGWPIARTVYLDRPNSTVLMISHRALD